MIWDKRPHCKGEKAVTVANHNNHLPSPVNNGPPPPTFVHRPIDKNFQASWNPTDRVVHLSIIMDEIAPEYDVVVLGTGMEQPRMAGQISGQLTAIQV